MKPLEEAHVCVVDYGSFLCLADAIGRKAKRCSYYSPFEQEYICLERCVIGDGMKHFARVDEYLDPDFFASVDAWVFPDIGYAGLQRYLRSIGKPVFGSFGATDLELYRTRFLSVIKSVGLEIVKSQKIVGLTALSEHLREVKNKWVKVNRYRDDMETWHHIDYQHSQNDLTRLACAFGPLKEHVVFVVQDAIDDEEETPVLEVGYDGLTVDGQFPPVSYQGYEKKNQLYLGSQLANEDLPDAVQAVNQAMAPVLADFGYRNFWATEIRIKGEKFYFIDPTARMAGQTMEHLCETCTNLPDVIYRGASGEIVTPKFANPFAAEATLHYSAAGDGWKTLKVPESVEEWVKLYRCCFADGAYQFPPGKNDEVGVVLGNGDTVEEAIGDLQEHFEELKDEPVSIEIAGFVDLLKQIQQAEQEGVDFSEEPIPEPVSVLEES